MSDAPEPLKGKRFILYKPEGQRRFWAHILMPDGYREKFDTEKTIASQAQSAAVVQVKRLYKARGIKTPGQERAERGETSDYVKRRQRKGLPNIADGTAQSTGGHPVPRQMSIAAVPAGPPVAAMTAPPFQSDEPSSDDGNWAENVAKIEDKFAKAFHRIQALLLLGGAEDPFTLRDHVRAIVVEATLGVAATTVKKPRVPYGTGARAQATAAARRGRPPGS